MMRASFGERLKECVGGGDAKSLQVETKINDTDVCCVCLGSDEEAGGRKVGSEQGQGQGTVGG